MRTGQREDHDQNHLDRQAESADTEADGRRAPARGRRIRGLDAEERRDQRRAQLLEAALELFARQSYARTSIEQICQTAFVGTKGFYELFSSKEECYLALLRQIAQDAFDKLEEAAGTAPDDELQASRLLVVTFAEAMTDDFRKVKVSFGEGAGISPEINRERRANRRWAAGFVEALWQRFGAGTEASRAGVDLHAMAVGLIGGLFDQVVDWVVESETAASEPGSEPTSPDIDALINNLTSFYLVVRSGLDHPAR